MKNYKIMMLMALSLSFAVQASWCESMCMLSSCCLRTREVAGQQGIERFEQQVGFDHAQANQMLLRADTAEQVQAALDAGADVHARNNYSRTALMNAAGEGRENAVRMLLAAGADVNARDDLGWTVLMNTTFVGREDIARMLLEVGADVNARSNAGLTALMGAAVVVGHENAVRMLLGWNDQIDALLARDDISDEAKLRLVALEPQAVQDTFDEIQTARQDQANEIHDFAIAVSPEIMQMLQDYLGAHPVSDYLLK